MKKIAVAVIAGSFASLSFGAIMSVDGPINSEANWGGSLTKNENYSLRAIGTVSSTDHFTLTGDPANRLLVADSAVAAVINMDGGTFNVASAVFLGHHASGTGTLNLSGGTLSTVGDLGIARFQAGAQGTANISGGTLSVGNNLLIGRTDGNCTSLLKYTGGSISAGGNFHLVSGGTLQFQLGSGSIVATSNRVTNGSGVLEILFGGGYSHVAGTTNVLVSSAGATGTGILLKTDSGNVSMTNGAEVKVNGNDFSVINTSTTLGLVAIPEPATVGLFVISSAGLLAVRRFMCR